MGAETVHDQPASCQVEGLKNLEKLMIGDLKQAAAPETPPRADVAMDVCQSPAKGPECADGSQHRAKSDGKWQVLPRQYELSDFQPIKKLYRGYASKVYLAEDVGRHKLSQEGRYPDKDVLEQHKVVLKVYDLLKLSPLTKYQLDREIKLHSSVSHRNIVRLEAAFTQTDFAILVQDYAPNGDLYTFLHKQRVKFSERKIITCILAPCMDALAYLHARNIAHRDIKPENLLLDEHNRIMLADFGLSVCVTEENAVTRAGTMDYMAPEVLVCPLKRLPTDYKDRTDLAYSVKVDSWSIGVLAFELITGRTPYRRREEDDMLKIIKSTDIKFPSSMSSLARDWIQRAMALNAHERASIQELANHPWITSHMSLPPAASLRLRSVSTVSTLSTVSSSPNSIQQQQSGAHPEALVRRPSLIIWTQKFGLTDSIEGSTSTRQDMGRASSVFRDQVGVPPSTYLDNPPPPAEDNRSEESRIPKSPSRANSFMQQISAHLKPALFGTFRDKPPARENQ